VPGPPFVAATCLGMIGGLVLGALSGVLFAADAVYSMPGYRDYAASLGLFALPFFMAGGLLAGGLVGILDGLVLAALSETPVLRTAAGLSRTRGTVAVAVTTGLSGFGVLYLLFGPHGGLITYPVTVAAALVSVPLSHRLPWLGD
jgi:hypothetical protein